MSSQIFFRELRKVLPYDVTVRCGQQNWYIQILGRKRITHLVQAHTANQFSRWISSLISCVAGSNPVNKMCLIIFEKGAGSCLKLKER